MSYKEHYHAVPMAANASSKRGALIAGFLPVTAGTLTITDASGTVTVNAVPVSAGVYVKIPLMAETTAGCTVTLAGGASGTLFC